MKAKILFTLLTLQLLVLLLGLASCKTASVEQMCKAKCVSTDGSMATFEYYYFCHKKQPCAIIFQGVDNRKYIVGNYYWVKYRR